MPELRATEVRGRGGLPSNPLAALFYSPWFWVGCGVFLLLLFLLDRILWRMREQRRQVRRYTDGGWVDPLPPHQLCSRWLCYDRPERRPCPRSAAPL